MNAFDDFVMIAMMGHAVVDAVQDEFHRFGQHDTHYGNHLAGEAGYRMDGLDVGGNPFGQDSRSHVELFG